MSGYARHPYHLVSNSPWPIVSSLFVGFLVFTAVAIFEKGLNYSLLSYILVLNLVSILMSSFLWWSDVVKESTYMGLHTLITQLGLRWGMALFILSEVMFFVSFFWAFFHSSLIPSIWMGGTWPPMGVEFFDPFSVPFLNTVVLLSSGVSVTWCHHSVLSSNHSTAVGSLLVTILQGVYFTVLQAIEYSESMFSINDGVFGSVFFIGTGFHGIHVIIGSLFLLVTLLRIMGGHLNSDHHFGLEAAAWYWHFVDVVWLFLYFWFYFWTSLS